MKISFVEESTIHKVFSQTTVWEAIIIGLTKKKGRSSRGHVESEILNTIFIYYERREPVLIYRS